MPTNDPTATSGWRNNTEARAVAGHAAGVTGERPGGRPVDHHRKLLWLAASYSSGLGYMLLFLPDPLGVGVFRSVVPSLPLGAVALATGLIALAVAGRVVPGVGVMTAVLACLAAIALAGATSILAIAGHGGPLAGPSGLLAFATLAAGAALVPWSSLGQRPATRLGGAAILLSSASAFIPGLGDGWLARGSLWAVAAGVPLGVALLQPHGRRAGLALRISAAAALGAMVAHALSQGIPAHALIAAIPAVTLLREMGAGGLARVAVVGAIIAGLVGLVWDIASLQQIGGPIAIGRWQAGPHPFGNAAVVLAGALVLAGGRPAWRAAALGVASGLLLVLEVVAGPGSLRLVPTTVLVAVALAMHVKGARGSVRGHVIAAVAGSALAWLALVRAVAGPDVGTIDASGLPALPGTPGGWTLLGIAMVMGAVMPLARASVKARSTGVALFLFANLVMLLLTLGPVEAYAALGADPARSEQLSAEVSRLRYGLLAAYALLAGVLAVLTTRSVIVPLEQLLADLRRYMAGDRRVRSGLTASDEIGVLGRTLDAFADDLDRSEEERRAADRRFREQVMRDELTGLSSRLAMVEGTRRLVGERACANAAFMFLDLDDFRSVNESFGHEVGDELLTEVARRLAAVVAPGVALGRQAADEFAILLPGATPADALAVAAAARSAVALPLAVRGHSFHITASAGVAMWPEGPDQMTLWKNADIALAAAKREGAGVVLFEPSRHAAGPDRLLLLMDLSAGIDRGELVVQYQPQLDLRTGTIRGAEALVRWRHPRRGLLLPGEFVPLAERSGVIRKLDLAVLGTVLAQLERWRADDVDLDAAVNLSARSLTDAATVGEIVELVQRHRDVARHLTVELTEESLVSDLARARTSLATLRQLSVHVSVDDFGTGHSSLLYLRDLAVDEVKIDQTFVRSMRRHADDLTIVRAVSRLGHDLRRRVVAEGVEDPETLELLRTTGCDAAQGFLIGAAMPPDALVTIAVGGTRSADHGTRFPLAS